MLPTVWQKVNHKITHTDVAYGILVRYSGMQMKQCCDERLPSSQYHLMWFQQLQQSPCGLTTLMYP